MKNRNIGIIIRLWIVIFTISAGAIIYYFDSNVRPLVNDVTVYKASTDTERLVNVALEDVLSESKIDFDDVIKLSYNKDKSLKAVATDSVILNKFRTRLNKHIIDVVNNYDEGTVSIRVGSFVGNEVFNGRGPKISFDYEMANNVDSYYTDEIVDAGINQVKHRLILNIEIKLYIITPFFDTTTEVNDQVLLNEIVIVGDVPNTYLDLDKK